MKLVEQNHGTVYMRPKDLPNRGRVAVVKDPLGAVFAMINASGGDPPDKGMMENFWMGSELWTSNVDAAMDFYHLLFGYEKELVDVGTSSKYCLLVKDGQPRAGMVKIPSASAFQTAKPPSQADAAAFKKITMYHIKRHARQG